MAMQYGISPNIPTLGETELNPVLSVAMFFLGDGTSTSITVPFSRYPFRFRPDVGNVPCSFRAVNGVEVTTNLDPVTLDCIFTFPTAIAENATQSIQGLFFYEGV